MEILSLINSSGGPTLLMAFVILFIGAVAVIIFSQDEKKSGKSSPSPKSGSKEYKSLNQAQARVKKEPRETDEQAKLRQQHETKTKEKAIKSRTAYNKDAIEKLEGKTRELSTSEFFQLRETIKNIGQNRKSSLKETIDELDCTGIYVLYNATQGKHYVGRSIKVLDRVAEHFFTLNGSNDILESYASGDYWRVRIIPLQDSGFVKLSKLETHAIKIYEGYTKGFNKTRGDSY